MTTPATDPVETPVSREPRENMLASIGFSIVLPVLILYKGTQWLPFLSPAGALIVALAFPIAYFTYFYHTRRKVNFFSVVGFISVLLTGGIGLLKLSPWVFAIKETAVPLVFGIAIVLTLKTRKPLVKMFLLNPSVVNVDKIEQALDSDAKKQAFQRLVVVSTWILASAFLVSAVLNLVITRWVVRTHPNVDANAFNAEIATQTTLTFIIITACTLPMMVAAMWKIFSGLKKITGYSLEELVHENSKSR